MSITAGWAEIMIYTISSTELDYIPLSEIKQVQKKSGKKKIVTQLKNQRKAL
jgi:hypothetical protein